MSIRYDLLDPVVVMERLLGGTPRDVILNYAAILKDPKRHEERKFQDWHRKRHTNRHGLPIWHVLCLFCRDTFVHTDMQVHAGVLDAHRDKHIEEILQGKYAAWPRALT